MFNKKLTTFIWVRKREMGLTNKDLADKLGLTPRQVELRLSGQVELSVSEMERMAPALGYARFSDMWEAAGLSAA